ncbi:hypothetical protein [Sinomonas soli]
MAAQIPDHVPASWAPRFDQAGGCVAFDGEPIHGDGFTVVPAWSVAEARMLYVIDSADDHFTAEQARELARILAELAP